jgi:hypothetical protein
MRFARTGLDRAFIGADRPFPAVSIEVLNDGIFNIAVLHQQYSKNQYDAIKPQRAAERNNLGRLR